MYKEMEDGVIIKHSRNGGETKVGRFLVDGYCEDWAASGMDAFIAIPVQPRTLNLERAWEKYTMQPRDG